MSKFSSKPKQKSDISTASLPDIVFLLLFFFMMTAVIRTKQDQQRISEPRAQAITQVDQKTLIKELSIGQLKEEPMGAAIIMAKDQVLSVKHITQWALTEQETLPEHLQAQMIVMLRADEEVKMGLISDIQQELRKANTRKVLFRALEED